MFQKTEISDWSIIKKYHSDHHPQEAKVTDDRL